MSDLEAETQEFDMQNALAIGRAIAKHFGVTKITSLSVDDHVIALDFKIKGVGYDGEEVNADVLCHCIMERSVGSKKTSSQVQKTAE